MPTFQTWTTASICVVHLNCKIHKDINSVKTFQCIMKVTAENSLQKIIGQKIHIPSALGKQYICVPTALDNNGTNAWL